MPEITPRCLFTSGLQASRCVGLSSTPTPLLPEKTLFMFPWENSGGFTLCLRSAEIWWFVSLRTIQSDPHLISSKQGWGGAVVGLNPSKFTQWALTSPCSFLFSFITHSFLSLAFAPTLLFFFYLLNIAELLPLPVSQQTGQMGDALETTLSPHKQTCLFNEANIFQSHL